MNKIWTVLSNHFTKLLGLAQGTIAAVAAVDGIIPANHLKYWMAGLGVLTFWRGWTNSQNQTPPAP
jgi:hypothetical protein